MNTVLQDLLKLQALEFGETTEKNVAARAAELREKLPPTVVGHYDRLRVRGKKGVAIVRNQVCTGCHMRVPIGIINELMHGEDIQLCEICGRYLYLPDPAETEFINHLEAAKPVAKPAAKAPAKPAAKAPAKAPAKPRKRRAMATA